MLKWKQNKPNWSCKDILSNETLEPQDVWKVIAIKSVAASFLLFAPLTNATKKEEGKSSVTSYQRLKSNANNMLKLR